MDNHQHAPVLSWGYLVQAKSVEELRHSLVCTTLELEQTRIAVEEEVRKRDDQISDLKLLLGQAIAQRDEAHHKIQALLLQTPQPHLIPTLSTISTLDDDASFDCCDVSSPDLPLPQKGKLLQAVMKAGPLLHTLLLAGPLPQWRHPPPPLVIPFPPPPPPPLHAHNSGLLNNKRPFSLCQDLDSPTPTKLHTLVFH